MLLKRIDTPSRFQLDLLKEEGGYPKDVFEAGPLPGSLGAVLEIDLDKESELITFKRVKITPAKEGEPRSEVREERIVGLLHSAQAGLMHPLPPPAPSAVKAPLAKSK
jgi:hypothetical protein